MMKPADSSGLPRPPSRQRAPLAALGMGHPSRAANIPTIAINPTAPLNVKPKKSGKLANVSDGPQVVIKDSHNELKAILADPPRRRASSSAVETLSAPLALRSVSAPMVYRAPGRSPSPPPTPSPIREGAPDVLQSKNPVVENKTAAGMDIEGLERQVANIKTTLDTQWSTLNNLASSVAEIKSSQVCSEDVVNGIKMVIEYFQGARSEDRKWIVDAVEGQIGEMGKQLTNLFKVQSETIEGLRQEITNVKDEREQCKQEAVETRKLIEATTERVARIEEFFVEENKTLTEENAHLVEHIEEATAEIASLRQELAGFKDKASTDESFTHLGTEDDKTEKNDKPPVPGTPAKFRKTHTRTPSTPHTPIVPGMYPRVSALRREAMENNAHHRPRNPGDGAPPAPRIPALVPQSPFAFRFK